MKEITEMEKKLQEMQKEFRECLASAEFADGQAYYQERRRCTQLSMQIQELREDIRKLASKTIADLEANRMKAEFDLEQKAREAQLNFEF